MDALSDILELIRLKSSVYFRKDFASPWGMEMGKSSYAQFHMVVRGHCWLKSKFLKNPIELYAGDIVIFLNGDEHWLADDPSNKRISGIKVVEAHHRKQELFKGKNISTTLVCGHFEFEKGFNHPLLKSLPKFLHIKDTERRELTWLETATNVIMQETGSNEPGADAVVKRLAEILLIQILRVYMLRKNVSKGYLAALKDHQINNALKLIHTKPDESWTLENIARQIGMSRAAFAAKFKHLIGITPMNYLTSWRMFKARELIRQRHLSLFEIAESVGYSSEASFNRAFKKQFKKNPGAMRKEFAE